MKTNDGGSAYPTPSFGNGITLADAGLTKRDYFAAHALQGICASPPGTNWTDEMIAKDAFKLADAMIDARNNQREKE